VAACSSGLGCGYCRGVRRILLASSIALALAPPPAPAIAQEPCPRCIEPSTARADSKLRVDHPTTRAVWNPPPRLLSEGDGRFHVTDSPSVVVYDGITQPGFVCRAPEVEPGRYLVALFGGSEGDGRYTWDFVQLEAGLPDEAADDGLPGWAVAIAIAAGLLIAAAAALMLRSRRQPSA